VELIEDLGDMALLDLEVGGIRMRARVRDGTPPREGDVIHVAAQEKDLHLFDRATGARIESQADAA
jgi:ABC-type sugar transport system ATPase subunit